jgi:hypothetical protein
LIRKSRPCSTAEFRRGRSNRSGIASASTLVNPANRRKHTILIVGSGLADAAATLGQ